MKIVTIIILIILCEIVVGFAFSIIAQIFSKNTRIDFKSLFKGLIERMFLMIFFYNDMPHALTFFSALKLATRLKHDENGAAETEKFSNYYLVGNLVSVTIALFYTYLCNHASDLASYFWH